MEKRYYGRWLREVNERWEIKLPHTFKMSKVILKEGRQGLEIHPLNSEEIVEEEAPFVFLTKIRHRKIQIPCILRQSKSFWLGRKVMIAGKGNYLEIWPWR